MLKFGWDFEVDAWLRFWRRNLINICLRTCDMTQRSYFGKQNSTLGSVVPLAMFVLSTVSAAKAWLCNQTSVKNHIQLFFFNCPDNSKIVEKEDNFQLLFEPNDIVLSIGEEVTVLSINLFRAHLSVKNMKCKNLISE